MEGRTPSGLSYSIELIRLIRERFDFSVGAACFPEVHPEAPDLESDLRYAREKVEAGADFLITQLFLDNELYFDFVERGPRGRHRRADHPGDHAGHQLQPDQDDHRHVRGHDPGASSSASWTGAPTTRKRLQSWESPTRLSSAPISWRGARPASTSTR